MFENPTSLHKESLLRYTVLDEEAYEKDQKASHQKELAEKVLDTLLVYAKTQLLVLAVITAVTWIILTLLGVRYALILAFVTGAFSAVPFLV